MEIYCGQTFTVVPWNKSIAYSVAVSLLDSTVYVTGSSRSDTTEASSDMVTLAYDLASGVQIDSAKYNGPTNNLDIAYDVKVDSSGNAYVTGYTAIAVMHLGRVPSAIVAAKYNYSSLNKRIRPCLNCIPKGFALHQNYPNPFNPSTTIKFDIPKSSNVKLVVYNILGQQVATLVNEYMKGGSYQIIFNMPKLSSGVYFYVLTADSYRDVKKMVLIK